MEIKITGAGPQSQGVPRLSQGASIYLDAVRLIAAFVVFLDHFSMHSLTGGLFYQVAPFGAEAVIVFFVLSGYVISYATNTRENSAGVYVVNRAARIYSVALPALAATFLFDAIGWQLKPDIYLSMPNFRADGSLWQFVSGVFFINELWWMRTPTGSDLPYWSLGFEIWYYAIFGVAMFAHGRWRIVGALALLLIAGPKIAALFPLWLIGFAAYRWGHRLRVPATLLFFVPLAGWIVYEISAMRYDRLLGVGRNMFQRENFAQDYLVGTLFAIHLVGIPAIAPAIERLPRRALGAVRWAAGASFTLYLFHMPLMLLIAAALPWEPRSWVMRATVFFGTLVGVILLAEVTERQKNVWRRAISISAGYVSGWKRIWI